MHMLPKIHVKTRGHLSFSTAGPQTTSLHLTSFHRNIDEKKKKVSSGSESLSMWSLHIHPMSAWVFSGYANFFPYPKDVHVR